MVIFIIGFFCGLFYERNSSAINSYVKERIDYVLNAIGFKKEATPPELPVIDKKFTTASKKKATKASKK